MMRRIYWPFVIAAIACFTPLFLFLTGINRTPANGDMVVLTVLGCMFLLSAFAAGQFPFSQKKAPSRHFEMRGWREIPFKPHPSCGKGTHAVWYRIGPRENDKKAAGVKCDGTEVYLQG